MYGFDYDKFNAYQRATGSNYQFLTREFKLKRNFDIFKQRLMLANNVGLITEEQADIRNYIKLTSPTEGATPIPFIEFDKSVSCLIKKARGNDKSEHSSVFEEITRQIGASGNICHDGSVELAESVVIDGRIYTVSYDWFNGQLFSAIKQNESGVEYLNNLTKPDGSVGIKSFGEFMRFVLQDPKNPLYITPEGFYPTMEDNNALAEALGCDWGLAHPYNYPQLSASPDEIMQTAIESGAKFIECAYGFANLEQMSHIKSFCNGLNSMVYYTGGTDKHKDFTDVAETTPWTLGHAVKTDMDITTENLQNVESIYLSSLQDLSEAQ